MASQWLQLAVCALAIAYAGSRLTRLADAIGEKTGMSASWVGVLLLADVSPVLAVTAFSAVMMSGSVIVGLVYRPRRRLLGTMSAVSAALLAVYLVNVHVLYVHQD